MEGLFTLQHSPAVTSFRYWLKEWASCYKRFNKVSFAAASRCSDELWFEIVTYCTSRFYEYRSVASSCYSEVLTKRPFKHVFWASPALSCFPLSCSVAPPGWSLGTLCLMKGDCLQSSTALSSTVAVGQLGFNCYNELYVMLHHG